MTNKENDNYKVEDEENIARIIFAPSMVYNGRVSPTAFCMTELPNGSESYVSVWRMSIKTPTRNNVNFPPRKDKDTLVGYAKLNAGECRKISFEDCHIEIHQHGKNLYHAGIEYTESGKRIKGVCSNVSFLMVTKMLSVKAFLFKFQ